MKDEKKVAQTSRLFEVCGFSSAINSKRLVRLLAANVLALTFVIPGHASSTRARRERTTSTPSIAIDHAGHYVSPDRACHATLKIASMGGFMVLTAGQGTSRELRVDDVTGMAWVGGHTLVYTTSPIYGTPGVFVYGCESKEARRIVAPRNVTKVYPDGNDFFELKGVSVSKPVTVYFYYAPNVEKVDFIKFRTPAFLFQVHVDGTDFRRAVGQ